MDSEQIAQILDQLGLRALLEQVPAALTAAIEAEAQFHSTTPPSSQATSPAVNWRRDLEAQLKPPALLQEVTRYLRERYRADIFQQAQQRLQEPLAKRARYFDLAMTQPGAEKNLRDFLVQNKLLQDRLAQADPAASKSEHGDNVKDARSSAARRTLLREIDAATASSLLTATLQSVVAARVHQAAGKGGVEAAVALDPKLLEDEIAERQRYLQPLATDYLLYDYRYLRDDELRDYRDLMRDEAVQTLLDMSRQALQSAIIGGFTPPPNPRQ